MGVLQGAVLSPFIFSLHTDSLSSCHGRLPKYADYFVLCNSYSKCSDQEGLDDDLYRLVTWRQQTRKLLHSVKLVNCSKSELLRHMRKLAGKDADSQIVLELLTTALPPNIQDVLTVCCDEQSGEALTRRCPLDVQGHNVV